MAVPSHGDRRANLQFPVAPLAGVACLDGSPWHDFWRMPTQSTCATGRIGEAQSKFIDDDKDKHQPSLMSGGTVLLPYGLHRFSSAVPTSTIMELQCTSSVKNQEPGRLQRRSESGAIS